MWCSPARVGVNVQKPEVDFLNVKNQNVKNPNTKNPNVNILNVNNLNVENPNVNNLNAKIPKIPKIQVYYFNLSKNSKKNSKII